MQTREFLVLIGNLSCLLQFYIVSGNTFCGNESTTDSCHRSCIDGCKIRVDKENMTKATVRENIATQTNLCVNKCYGNEYLPLRYADVITFPSYSDTVDCLGRCAQPAHTEYCMTGFLSNFFYCDCHKCCLQKTDSKNCVRGCHLWFLRQWSPKKAEGCRFREEYVNSPTEWCTAYCDHALFERDASLTWDDIRNIERTTAAQCIARCISFVLSGIPVDYDVDPDPCTDITKCMKVTAVEFKAFTSYTLDKAYVKSRIGSKKSMYDSGHYQTNGLQFAMKTNFNKSINITNEFDIRRSSALDNMHNAGIEITSEIGAEKRCAAPYDYSIFPWHDTGFALASAYNYNVEPRLIKGSDTFFSSEREFELQRCTTIKPDVLVEITVGIRFEHEVYVKITDGKSLFPLTAVQLRSAIAQRPEWQDLQFVTNDDANTLVMKGTGYGFAKYGIDLVYDDTCREPSSCIYPRNASATQFCSLLYSVKHRRGGPPVIIIYSGDYSKLR